MKETSIELKAEYNSIFIWGACERGKSIKECLLTKGIQIRSFIDSKKKGVFCNTEILGPDELPIDSSNNCIIIAAVTQRVTDDIISILEEKEFSGKVITNYEFHKDFERDYLIEKAINSHQDKSDDSDRVRQWFLSFLDEVRFWRFQVADKNGDWHYTYRRKFRKKEFECKRLPKRPTSHQLVMDVGCGICSPYGHYLDGQKMHLITVDPLAYFYNQINQRFLNDLTDEEEIPIVQFGMFEILSANYGKNYCDFVLVDNALDHCINPLQALIECINTVKVGGCVSLQHHSDEALREDYAGLHQWNISLNKKNELCFWNEMVVVNVNETIGDYVSIESWEERGNPDYSPYGVTICNIIKKRNIDNDDITIAWTGSVIDNMMHRMSEVEYATEMIKSLY